MRRQLPEMLHDERSADCGIPDGMPECTAALMDAERRSGEIGF